MIRNTIPPVFQGIKQRKFTFAAAFAGILFLMLIILLLSGLISFSPGIREAVIKGNGYYLEGSYDKALKAYKKGLSEKTEDPKLNFNAGQASYSLKNYQQAVSYYNKASDTVDKYLNAGNSCYKQAENTKDQNQKIQLLQQALDLYHQGILKFPQEISLKYNYELVKSKLDELKKNNQNKNDQDKDQQDKDQQNKDKNKDQNKDQNNQKNQQQNKNGNEKDQQNKQDKNDSSNQNKSKEKDQKNNQDSEQQKKDKQKKQQEGSKSDKKDNNKKTTGQESPINQGSTKDSKADKNSNEVTQVLQMLEKQEENSLKNNQEVKGKGKEDRYDW